nr:putative ribonuclease h protein [Quercus suber]
MERVREKWKRLEEEEDTLVRNTKKFKDNHFVGEGNEGTSITRQGSYKDKLVGAIPGAFKQAFGFSDTMHEDLESDIEDDNPGRGSTRIFFSKEEKSLWIRLSELPIEFYEPSALLKIGKAIGPVLRIDANTANAESSQASSVNSVSRALGYDKIDGKRKASHLMPNNTLREADRMHRSSCRFSGLSKANGEAEGNRSAKQKAKDMVQSQRVEQEVGVVADEGRSMGEHSESLVEVSDRQTGGVDPFSDQLRVVSNRIKGANFRKISGRGRSRMDTARYHKEEDTSKQANKVLVARESPQSEIDAIRRTFDQLNNAHQSLLEHDGDYQALDHLAQGATRVEDEKRLELNCSTGAVSDHLGIPWKVVFPMGIWQLWLAHNMFHFRTGVVDTLIHTKSIKESAEFFSIGAKDRCNKMKKVIRVAWEKPALGWMKLNFDGSALGNLGKAGGGGLIRDHQGNWVRGYARAYGNTSNSMCRFG